MKEGNQKGGVSDGLERERKEVSDALCCEFMEFTTLFADRFIALARDLLIPV